jgi:branched-chain amino acid transport system substrate-binding protein
MLRAAELAVQQINASGGAAGRPIELIPRDDHGDPDSAIAIATELAQAGVIAVVGDVYSGTTLAAAPVYNSAQVIQISPSSSSPLLSGAGPWTFRTCPSDLQHGAVLARFAAEQLGLRRATVLYLNDEYGRGLRQTFALEFSRVGGMVEEMDPYLGSRPDVGTYLDRLARRGTSDFIFLGRNRGEAEETLRAARAHGVRLPLFGGDGLEGLEEAGPLAEGSYVSSGYLASIDTPRNREFVAAYRREHPRAPLPHQPAAATYDIMYLLRNAIAKAGTNPQHLRDAISANGGADPPFEGVTGAIAFDENGDVPRQPVVVGRIENGTVRAVGGL